VWNKVQEKYRRAIYTAKLLACQGVVQKEGQVLHVIADHIWDWSDQFETPATRRKFSRAIAPQPGFSLTLSRS